MDVCCRLPDDGVLSEPELDPKLLNVEAGIGSGSPSFDVPKLILGKPSC